MTGPGAVDAGAEHPANAGGPADTGPAPDRDAPAGISEQIRDYLGQLSFSDPSIPLAAVAVAVLAVLTFRQRGWTRIAVLICGSAGFAANVALGLFGATSALAYTLARPFSTAGRTAVYASTWVSSAAATAWVVAWSHPGALAVAMPRGPIQTAAAVALGVVFLLTAAGLLFTRAAASDQADDHGPRNFAGSVKDQRLAEQDYRCNYWDEGCPAVHDPDMGCTLHADHIVAWADGGTSDADNCQMLCPSCNVRKGDLSDDEARRLTRQHFGYSKHRRRLF